MEKETTANEVSIITLPDEIISLILLKSNCSDILNFGLTCKSYNTFVTNNHYVWKKKIKDIVPNDTMAAIELGDEDDWKYLYKKFYLIKRQVYYQLTILANNHYDRVDEVRLSDAKDIFNIALTTDSATYSFVIFLLQDLVKQTNKRAEENECEEPFTMTNSFYARAVLRFMMHSYLTVKWTQGLVTNELHPEFVLNYFMQWMDPMNMHDDEDVEIALQSLVQKVEKVIMSNNNEYLPVRTSITEKLAKGTLKEREVLAAITEVIYTQQRMTVIDFAKLDTMDLLKVINNKCGDAIVIAIIYLALARRCGVQCELIAFPNHLVLQWRQPQEYSLRAQYYKLFINTGEWVPKGRCPFTQTHNNSYQYSPDSLLKYIIAVCFGVKGQLSDWEKQTSTYLVNFLNNNPDLENPYKNFLPYLLDYISLRSLDDPVTLRLLTHSDIQMINALLHVNPVISGVTRNRLVKKRNGDVKYAVGMVCMHKKYEYLCVIRGWDLKYGGHEGRVELKTLRYGADQPFYDVIAVDRSSRYVAQENITELPEPSRLHHLEDSISKDFSHFDGYSYVLSKGKKEEYPVDDAIREVFRIKAEMRDLHKVRKD